MKQAHHELYSHAIGASGAVAVFGHWGRAVLVFPSAGGRAYDWRDNGMVGAIEGLIDGGRVKLYCVDSWDSGSWHDGWLPLEERARRHGAYEDWLLGHVVPTIHWDCGGSQEIVTTGVSFGAFHAANLALRRADLFPLAVCLSGIYDVSAIGWGQQGEAMYFNNPAAYVHGLHGDHLDWLRTRVSLLLVVGQGMWEDTTGALEHTRRFAEALADKGIRHELDVWGYDVPHDWPSWRAQIAHHLPRFA
jgi:esterase/lipase superfamily enzyme